jgi:hypothetical protein
MKKRKVYTPGMADVDGVIDHLENEHKRARRIEWLKEHYSKSMDKQKGGTSNENQREP